jgi:hypothetical protein
VSRQRIVLLLWVVRAVGAASVTALGWLLAPATASACDVGIGYKPSISFSGNSVFGSTCSTGTSLAGVAIVAVLVVAALAALASSVLKRAVVQAESLAGAGDAGDGEAVAADRALNTYLESVGLGSGRTEPPADPGRLGSN